MYYDDVYVRYTVEFDGIFAPYSACNPVAHNDWECTRPGAMEPVYASAEGGGQGVPDPGACDCPLGRQKVGWIPKNVSHRPCLPGESCPHKPPPPARWPANGYELQTLVGGHWFSTTAEGQCRGDQRVGDTSGCSWRIIGGPAPAKNVSCVHKRVMEAVLSRNESCFAQCPDGKDLLPTDPSDCWTLCVFSTILGEWNGFTGRQGMHSEELVGPFEQAMAPEAEGGCPQVEVAPVPPA